MSILLTHLPRQTPWQPVYVTTLSCLYYFTLHACTNFLTLALSPNYHLLGGVPPPLLSSIHTIMNTTFSTRVTRRLPFYTLFERAGEQANYAARALPTVTRCPRLARFTALSATPHQRSYRAPCAHLHRLPLSYLPHHATDAGLTTLYLPVGTHYLHRHLTLALSAFHATQRVACGYL